MSRTADLDPLAEVQKLAPGVRERAPEIEAARRLPPDLADAFTEAGLFRLVVPRSLGGLEVDLRVLFEAIEAMSAADGSAGWCLMIGASTAVLAPYLPEAGAKEIYGSDQNVVTGGALAPRGNGRAVDGGYRVTGRWPFVSGVEHCSWLTGGFLDEDGDFRMAYFPASDVEIIDTWDVSGLRGTGSHDMAVDDVFVPSDRSVALLTATPRDPGPLYRFPIFGFLGLNVAAVALGIAGAAVNELTTLATTKTPTMSGQRLAERNTTQADVGRAAAALLAARAFFFAEAASAWEVAERGDEFDLEQRARLRLVAVHAARTAADVVDVMYDLGGGTSIYATSPLQRQFRDVHAVTQHIVVAPATYELGGRVLLGVEGDTFML
ncbi:MAG: acyl-CoA dehydrogenase family protein [Actinomycetota bacterium]